MQAVEAIWTEWAARVLPPDLPPLDRLHQQLVFYAGFGACLAQQGRLATEVNAFLNGYRATYEQMEALGAAAAPTTAVN